MTIIIRTILVLILALSVTIPLTAAAGRYEYDDGFYESSDYYAGEGHYSASDPFFDLLLDYGDWIAMGEYGLVWRPHGTPREWRPYTYGRWVATDAGWTWVSDWDWGWAPFHYGRWLQHHRVGWVWVPGDEWAPAWVDWREGDGLIGWAPLPPHVGWGPSLSLSLIFIDGDIVRPASEYHFVRHGSFLEPHLHRHILPRTRNFALVNSTRNVTNYAVVDRRVVNRSVDVDRLSRVLRRPIRRHRIVERSDTHVHPDRALRGNELQVFRPKFHGRGQPHQRTRVETRERRAGDADRNQRREGPRDRSGGPSKLATPETRRDAKPRSPQHYSLPRERRPAETASRRDSDSSARWTTERRARPRAQDDGRPDARVRRTEQTRKAAPAETRPGAERNTRLPRRSTARQERDGGRPDARARRTEQMRHAAPAETKPGAKKFETPRGRREPAQVTDRNARSPRRSTARQERGGTQRSSRPAERQRRDARANTSPPRSTPRPPRAERSRTTPRASAPPRDSARASREGAKRSGRQPSAAGPSEDNKARRARQSASSPNERGRHRERED